MIVTLSTLPLPIVSLSLPLLLSLTIPQPSLLNLSPVHPLPLQVVVAINRFGTDKASITPNVMLPVSKNVHLLPCPYPAGRCWH